MLKIGLITQNDRFFLPTNVEYLLANLPDYCKIDASFVFSASPFGSRLSFFKKIRTTISIFGLSFFAKYAAKYVLNILRQKSVINSLAKFDIPVTKVFNSINREDNIEKIRSLKLDLLISLSGNQIYKQPLIDSTTHGIINLHCSKLPKNRGLMPSFWSLANNDLESAVTVFFVDSGIDSGPIHVQKQFPIKTNCQSDLIEYSKNLGVDAILESIQRIRDGDLRTIENADTDASYNSFPQKSDVKRFLSNGSRF